MPMERVSGTRPGLTVDPAKGECCLFRLGIDDEHPATQGATPAAGTNPSPQRYVDDGADAPSIDLRRTEHAVARLERDGTCSPPSVRRMRTSHPSPGARLPLLRGRDIPDLSRDAQSTTSALAPQPGSAPRLGHHVGCARVWNGRRSAACPGGATGGSPRHPHAHLAGPSGRHTRASARCRGGGHRACRRRGRGASTPTAAPAAPRAHTSPHPARSEHARVRHAFLAGPRDGAPGATGPRTVGFSVLLRGAPGHLFSTFVVISDTGPTLGYTPSSVSPQFHF